MLNALQCTGQSPTPFLALETSPNASSFLHRPAEKLADPSAQLLLPPHHFCIHEQPEQHICFSITELRQGWGHKARLPEGLVPVTSRVPGNPHESFPPNFRLRSSE